MKEREREEEERKRRERGESVPVSAGEGGGGGEGKEGEEGAIEEVTSKISSSNFSLKEGEKINIKLNLGHALERQHQDHPHELKTKGKPRSSSLSSSLSSPVRGDGTEGGDILLNSPLLPPPPKAGEARHTNTHTQNPSPSSLFSPMPSAPSATGGATAKGKEGEEGNEKEGQDDEWSDFVG